MRIEILGTGCPKCEALAHKVEEAARTLGVEYELCKVTQINEIMQRGVMMTPALVVDGQVKIAGKVPDVDQLKSMLAGARP